MSKGFILIPGAGMSDWIWVKLLPLLNQKAVTISKRIEHNSYANRITCHFNDILDYADKVIEQSGLEEIILVGHSGAGLIAGELGKRNRKVKHVIFIAANIPKSGGTALDFFSEDIRDKNIEGVKQQAKSDVIPMKGMENLFRTYFCNKTTEEDIKYIMQQSFQPEPVCVLTHKADWTDYPDIRKSYLICNEDKTLTREQQERFASNLKITDIYYLDSDHMSMISHASELAKELNDITAGFTGFQ